MDEIIARLRNSYKTDALWDVCNEAADALEHLTAKCKHLETEVARLERLSNG
jgi:hypothetical protein